MDENTIHLIYGSDDNYWFPTAISAASAAYGCSQKLVVHLFDAGVSDAHYHEYEALIKRTSPQVVCERHPLSPQMFSGFGAWKGSFATYSRMFIQDILPNLDWAIYCDGDTLWLGDIAKLWALRDETKLILASYDPPTPLGEQHPEDVWFANNGITLTRQDYLCMGLILVNIKGMRAANASEQIKAFMAKYPQPPVVDQTVLNYVCRGKIAPLPKEWGVFSVWHGTADLTKDGCVHYVDDLPWRRHKINRLISDIVLVWYEFTQKVLGLNLRSRYLSRTNWCLRRVAFLVAKHMQCIIKLNPFVHSRLRNTHGLSRPEWKVIRNRWR